MFSAATKTDNVAAVPNYIEDMFSTYLYTGNSTTQTITNGIDLAGKGGAVWIKCRSTSATNNNLIDSVRGISKFLYPNDTSAQANDPGTITSFNSNGFTQNNSYGDLNSSGRTYVSWTFREQPKFFDIVTYTGTGSNTTIPHNLGSVPGCIIVKCTSVGGDYWCVYHRSTGGTAALFLNVSDASLTNSSFWNNTTPTSTDFTVGSANGVNGSGRTYVAYVFAHNAGGFGLTGTDNVVSCGSFTTDGTGAAGNITLGYESQWLLIKRSDGAGSWNIIDTMRGSSLTSYNYLQPNTTSLESSSTSAGQGIFPTATGFFVGTNFPAASATYIYIAIRRGPMKVPTLGTSVFEPATYTGNGTNPRTVGTLQVTDLAINMNRPDAGDVPLWVDRLRGPERYLYSSGAAAEAGGLTGWLLAQSGQTINGIRNTSPTTYVDWLFRRAPGFFDEVCYTGTGVAGLTVAHNLTVVPELMIVKGRSIAEEWNVYFGNNTNYLKLNSNDVPQTATTRWNDTSPTSSVFSLGTSGWVNQSGSTYVAYLFATCPGVSKVGSYTGTGALQTVACGFTSGARFVLIKRTDSTGDWYVWDSARGITSGNDPYLLLNSTAAEVTSTNYVDTDTTGFKVTAAAPVALNAVGGTYIFLAVA
jgi:hypothetical protein